MAGDRAQRAAVLSALGDPSRLAVVDLLQVQDLSPHALAAALEIPGNNVEKMQFFARAHLFGQDLYPECGQWGFPEQV